MKTATFVCGDEPPITLDGHDVHVIPDLCARPLQIAESGTDADNAVVVLHRKAYDLAHVQKALRATDIDPLGAQVLDVEPHVEVAAPTLAGLAARAAAFSGSEPESAKPVFPQTVTRRGFLRMPAPVYVPVPRVDHGTCAAADGCRACVDTCPQDAYTWRKGRIQFNKDACEPCGRCVAVCPTEAIENPAATPAMLASQIAAAIGTTDDAVGIQFVCSRADIEASDGWLDVAVPCTGMVRGAWLISALLIGSGAVAVLPCSAGGCALGLDEHAKEAVDFARSALAAAGLNEELVTLEAGVIGRPMDVAPIADPFTWSGDLDAMMTLSSISGDQAIVRHAGSSTAQVTINPATCTLCAQCARTCPTEAIEAAYDGDVVSISFDASRCTNCRQCLMACPEADREAIDVTGMFDPEQVAAGGTELHRGSVLVCESCGNPIAPSPMMDRIGELLGDEFGDTMQYLSRRCLDCRGTS